MQLYTSLGASRVNWTAVEAARPLIWFRNTFATPSLTNKVRRVIASDSELLLIEVSQVLMVDVTGLSRGRVWVNGARDFLSDKLFLTLRSQGHDLGRYWTLVGPCNGPPLWCMPLSRHYSLAGYSC